MEVLKKSCMAKGKLSVRLGNKLLTLEDDGQADATFKKEFAAVCKTNPTSMQELFERLVQIQQGKNKRTRSIKSSNEKRANKRMN
jgi:hypothetical protein